MRDALLGLPVHDADWVVTGATPADMLAAGFTPVGRDFPVFLHPYTKEEYALARTERKSGQGYAGFTVYAAPGVTLEQDLQRRDFTINAIAVPAERLRGNGVLSGRGFEHIQPSDCIDPFGGLSDLKNRILRHVSAAFSEDPLRILRAARFMAKFGDRAHNGFDIHPSTLILMRQMVQNGELSYLAAERIWQEISRGLLEKYPSAMLRALHVCQALPILFPGLVQHGANIAGILDVLANDIENASLPVRWAVFCSAACDEQVAAQWAKALRVPNECAQLAQLLWRVRGDLEKIERENHPQWIFDFLQNCDAWRKPERVGHILVAAQHLGWLHEKNSQMLQRDWAAAAGVQTASIAEQAKKDFMAKDNLSQMGAYIAGAIMQARLDAIKNNRIKI